MIPISDGRKTPHAFALYFLIALIVVGFDLQLFGGMDLVEKFGSLPFQLESSPREWLLRALTASFLHANAWHILGNLVYLFVFGKSVEHELGFFSFFIAFLLFGVAGFGGHWALQPGSHVPVIGASASISGVMGAYLIFFPHVRVKTLLGYWMIELPAWVLLLGWIGLQILDLKSKTSSNIAYGAHLGGFFTGLVFAVVWRLGPLKSEPKNG